MPIINQVVQGGGGSSVAEPYLEFSVDADGTLVSTTSRIINLSGVTRIINIPIAYAYASNTNISGVVDFSSIEFIGSVLNDRCMEGTFSGCRNITGINMSGLKQISGAYGMYRTFAGCHNITTANFSSLTDCAQNNAMQYEFNECSSLIDVDLRSLEKINYRQVMDKTFSSCTSLPTIKFQSLNLITGQKGMTECFKGCTSLASIWFYALTATSFGSRTDQFSNMLSDCTNVTVHFPIRIQSTIGSWSDVTAGFGGTNTTVLFDIVTTLTGADGNTYTRQEKDSTTTATAWVYNDTLYYTSGVSDNANGVNEPTVSDAIYSDAACTQSVTTITAIA